MVNGLIETHQNYKVQEENSKSIMFQTKKGGGKVLLHNKYMGKLKYPRIIRLKLATLLRNTRILVKNNVKFYRQQLKYSLSTSLHM